MLNKNSLPLGFILGLLIPFVGYALLLELFDQLDANNLISDIGFTENFRLRTTALLAICLNLIPFIIYNRKKFSDTMRGLIFPTVIYAIFWFIYFGRHLIS